MDVSEKIVIDLTKSLANVGSPISFCGDYVLESELLPYPNARLQKVAVNFNVTFENPDVAVQGTIACFVQGNCDRCLERVQKQFVLPFDQTFFKDVAEEDGYCYSGSKLDVTKAVQDELVVSLPTLLLCKDDCLGLCPKCGVNRNTTKCECDAQSGNVFSQLKNLKF